MSSSCARSLRMVLQCANKNTIWKSLNVAQFVGNLWNLLYERIQCNQNSDSRARIFQSGCGLLSWQPPDAEWLERLHDPDSSERTSLCFKAHETIRVFRNPAAIPGRSCNSCSLFLVFWFLTDVFVHIHPCWLGHSHKTVIERSTQKKNDPLNLIFQTPPTGQQLASTHPIRDSSDGVTDVCDLCTIWCRYWMRQFEAPWYQDKQHKPFQRKALWAIVNSCYGPCACFVWHMPWT